MNWINEVLVGKLSTLDAQASTLVNLKIEGVVPTDQAAFEVWAVSGGLQTETKVAAIQVMPPVVPVVPAPGTSGDAGDPEMNAPDVRVPTAEHTNKLILSVTKLTDPVDLGEPGGLLMSVVNDRDQMDENIEVMVLLPNGLEYLGGRATDSLDLIPDAENPRVLRAKRREMRAGDELVATLRVNPIQVGDQTVQVSIVSSLTTTPIEEEATLRVNP